MPLDGGVLVARTLEAFGSRYVFGLCGDHVNPIFDALRDTTVELVDMRDERGAGFAAEGWALATGEPGICCVTAGPGVANVVGPLADCHAWGVPIVVVAGRAPIREADRAHPGDMAQLDLVRPVTKWARTVFDAGRIPEYLGRAFAQAVSGRPGPTLVEIPIDVQTQRVDGVPALPERPAAIRPGPHPSAVAAARALLEGAERPVLVGGSGVWWSKAGEPLRAFAERHAVPVLMKGAGRGLLSDDHDLGFGLPNPLYGAASTALAEADAFVVCGTRLDLHLAHGAFMAGKPTVHIDVDPGAFGDPRPGAVHIAADAGAALDALAHVPPRREAWTDALRRARDAHAATIDERTRTAAPRGVHPAHLVGELRRLAGPATTIIVDAGELGLYAFELLPAYAPASLQIGINSPLGGLGPGVPFAIASALAFPDRRVVLLTGDGSLGFGAMELHTAARRGLAIDVVVGNDGAWGIIGHMQDLLYGRRTATDLGPLRYDGLATSLGCTAARVDGPESLADALGRRACGAPHLTDVLLDADAMHPLCPIIAGMFARPT